LNWPFAPRRTNRLSVPVSISSRSAAFAVRFAAFFAVGASARCCAIAVPG